MLETVHLGGRRRPLAALLAGLGRPAWELNVFRIFRDTSLEPEESRRPQKHVPVYVSKLLAF